MRVLITNITLAGRSGTEFFTRDLAHGLRTAGHVPVVYTPDPGSVADEIRADGTTVVASLDGVDPPDVIHGHHAGPTMEAVIRFAGVPAIYVVHDRTAWHDEPPAHPRIRRYVAVDENCLERLAGLPACVIHNAVDFERFRPRGPLPGRLRRALLLSNYATEETVAAAAREACARHGITLDVAGLHLGAACERPEAVLGSYDLVFGKARCAIEALAVGCAVVVCDVRGVGGLVTPANFARLRRLNFGAKTLVEPVTADALAREIARYDTAACAEASARTRAEARLEDQVARFVELYRAVLDEPRSTEPEEPAVAQFVGALHRARFDAAPLEGENRALWRERNEMMRQRDDALRAHDEAVRLRALKKSGKKKLLRLPLFGRISRILERAGTTALLPMPVVVGVQRSGTTLLRMMLDSHPLMAVPPETGWLAAVAPADARDAVLAKITGGPQWPDFHLSLKEFEAALSAGFTAADAVRAFYRLYAKRFGKSRWGEKTPGYGMHMESIERLLPEARFIHIVRDGRDVAVSVRDIGLRPGDTMEAIARDWCDRIRATRAQRVRHVLEVRYEELVVHPETVLRRVCGFIDLPFEPAMLEYPRRTTTRPPDRDRIGRWRVELSVEDVARFDHVAGALLRELGYEASNTRT